MTIYNCKVVVDSVKVRYIPNTANTSTVTMLRGTQFQISEIVPDSLDPTNTLKKWGHILGGVNDNKYTALEYPGNPSPISTYVEVIDPANPPVPPVVHVYPDMLEVVPVIDDIRYPMKIYTPKV